MTPHDAGPGTLLPGALLAGAAVVHLVAAAGLPAWPARRTACWLLGLAAAGAGVAAPAVHPQGHAAGHVLLGMVAPLLLVWAAPVTLALRALPRRGARALARLLRSRPVVAVAHPVPAALLDTGGLWLVFGTDLAARLGPAGAWAVPVHMLAAGYLFTASLVGPDPAPHRPGLALRAGVLVAVLAAHDVLAKVVYAVPGQEAAGLLLHYGAAPVHLALLVALGREWARGQRRARRAARRAPAVRDAPGDGPVAPVVRTGG